MHPTENPDIYVIKKSINPGETITFNTHGPCLLFLSLGEIILTQKSGEIKIQEHAIIVIPHMEFRLQAASPSSFHLILPDLVRQLADRLGVDYTSGCGIKRNRVKAVPLFESPDTTVNLFPGIGPEDLDDRDHAERKIRELSDLAKTLTSSRHRKRLVAALTSREWFFRIRVCDAAARCETVTEAAANIGLTPSGFSKRFKKVFGQPYYQWRQAQRFAEIKYKLQYTAIPLKDISANYGFYSVQHFGHAVKKYTGKPPGRLRGESRASENDNPEDKK
ncbi:MAG: AraC family transcriptional regulator [Alistipes sp.]|nr:AraC family transcriptional regulator [Alistipes sp.]